MMQSSMNGMSGGMSMSGMNGNMQPVEVQTANIGNEVLPVQQPILLQGGILPPLNVFHNPVWMTNQQEGMMDPRAMNNPQANQMQNLQRLNQLNRQLDDELYKLKPILNQNIVVGSGNQGNPQGNMVNQQSQYKFTQVNRENNQNQMQNGDNVNFPKISGFDSRFKETNLDFLGTNNAAPICIRREGMLKIRDIDQKDKDVVVTYAVLTKDRLSYFVNAKDESSIQGSVELAKIKESVRLINGFPTCFTIKTLDGVSDCSVCAESEDSSREWINAITQNAVNCNTMSALNNLNKRGLLK